MIPPRILIAGIGNIFFGDDAFGVEVLRRLTARIMPEGVRGIDFGIRGIDLAYALTAGYEVVIMVDALQRGGPPGTLYVMEPDEGGSEPPLNMDAHALDPWRVLGLARSLGGNLSRVCLVGCEPAVLEPDHGSMELSEPVQAAVEEAIRVIDSLVERFRQDSCVV